MHLRKNDLIEIVKNNFNNFGADNPDDNIDEIYFDGNTVDSCAEAIADDVFKKLKHDLFQFAERATDGDAIALSSEIDNYLIDH